MPLPLESMFQSLGVGAHFKPAASQAAYGDNVWLYSAITKIADSFAQQLLPAKRDA